jgi:cobalamin biosynthesis Mg chelatase CobN
MRRCIVLLLALVAAASLGPARAEAATPCRDKIFNQWYHDGKISSSFPLSCYRDALKHIPADVAVYSSLGDDIRLALQAAVDRSHGKSVPSEVGNGTRLTSSSASTNTSSTTPSTSSTSTNSQGTTTPVDTAPNAPDPGATTPTSSTPVAAPSTSSSSSSVPLPVLVLGGVALLLVASGAVGLGVRRYRRGHPG